MQTLEIKTLEEMCRECGGRCCHHFIHKTILPFIEEPECAWELGIDYMNLVSGFVNDSEFRKEVTKQLAAKYPSIQGLLYSKKTEEEKIKSIIELSWGISDSESCFYYLDGCIINKYKPEVCRIFFCSELKNIMNEYNGK